jgi:hypothetical protein
VLKANATVIAKGEKVYKRLTLKQWPHIEHDVRLIAAVDEDSHGRKRRGEPRVVHARVSVVHS